MKYLETNSRNTVDSIFSRQNDSFLLQCQVAQNKEYSSAKRIAFWKMVVTLIFAAISIAAAALNIEWLTALSGLLAVMIVIINKYTDTRICAQKRHASSVQQYIDATLYASVLGNDVSDWGEVPSKSDLAETISAHGTDDTSRFVNWYSDYSSSVPEAQVFYCQRENVRWNYDLHKKYRKLQVALLCGVAAAMLVAFFVVNPRFIKAVCVVSWFMPIAEYAGSIIKDVNNSIKLLQDIDTCCGELEKKLEKASSCTIKADLIKLQRKIWNHRANGYAIPDWFYYCHRENHQRKEDNIAKIIQNN